MNNKNKSYNPKEEIDNLLPGYNCGICGYARCEEFAGALLKKDTDIEKCRFMYQELFMGKLQELNRVLKKENIIVEDEPVFGLLDGYEADFVLAPLPEESSCREILYPFTQEKLEKGDIIRYRPLGCPITHFAEIIDEYHGLITVHMVGPCHRLENNAANFEYKEIGLCMVGGFEGIIEGEIPSIGQTVRFLPKHCMMQKVHSGVVVQLEGKRTLIEGIDLKVWAPPLRREKL